MLGVKTIILAHITVSFFKILRKREQQENQGDKYLQLEPNVGHHCQTARPTGYPTTHFFAMFACSFLSVGSAVFKSCTELWSKSESPAWEGKIRQLHRAEGSGGRQINSHH